MSWYLSLGFHWASFLSPNVRITGTENRCGKMVTSEYRWRIYRCSVSSSFNFSLVQAFLLLFLFLSWDSWLWEPWEFQAPAFAAMCYLGPRTPKLISPVLLSTQPGVALIFQHLLPCSLAFLCMARALFLPWAHLTCHGPPEQLCQLFAATAVWRWLPICSLPGTCSSSL